ncbi:Predicted DNA-binding transcriptional regulator YafY, contains an HTH and WYL domains [Ectothiorhodospira magna]|uniref:Predicted DNA-binding transcriptional regulator YafY, contains an HTH and WYL domains n=1 Tax=Ectothiorhodospira magna TaxID=867345 RepID=A0A1H9C7X5_9GAMM|nr:WYL domain-containing protein [Ectothiorhodospira magna]SEP96768.1 Predicted DNA-binding transcriptional regulator YafY, contains an HTH and WYL domains [Ectothiorhodospira magna]
MRDETLYRYLMILQLLPRHPATITAKEITQKLESQGFTKVSQRTIERNLASLSRHFNIIVMDEDSKPFQWCWQADAKAFQIPGLNTTAALITLMAWEYLRIILPDSQMEEIKTLQEQARASLEQAPHPWQSSMHDIDQWVRQKTAVIDVHPLQPARSVNLDVIKAVHEALFRDRLLKIDYRKALAAESKESLVTPLALVMRGQVTYLVVHYDGYDEPRILALQRIERAEVQDQAGQRGDFDLERYLAGHHFEFGDYGEIELELWVSEFMTQILRETPLNETQRIFPDPDDPDSYLLTARIRDTLTLRQWIRSQGADIVVLGPEQTRQAIAEEVMILNECYSS